MSNPTDDQQVQALDAELIQWVGPPALHLVSGDWLSIAAVAFGCRVSETAVRRWIDTGRLPAYQFPGRVAIKKDDLAEFLVPARVPVKTQQA